MRVGRVNVENDDLHFEMRGEGVPLLMIPGGWGDAWWYEPVAERLSDAFKVITYDRRANARSTANPPQNFDIGQQARDAVGVIRAAGEESAYVFGSSSGATIALQLAAAEPAAVRGTVAHEPPSVRALEDGYRWQRFFAGVYKSSFTLGVNPALLRFAVGARLGIPLREIVREAKQRAADREADTRRHRPSVEVSTFFVRHELLPVTNHLPDVKSICENGNPVVIAVGSLNADGRRWIARVAENLARQIGCRLEVFPGHHVSYRTSPDAFAAKLGEVLNRMQRDRPSSTTPRTP